MKAFARGLAVLTGLLFFQATGFAQGPPPGQQGNGIWLRNAYYGEFQTFDLCNGHQPGNGQYHHHIQPICLRAQLDDNLDVVKSGRTGTFFREKAAPWKHSPILGWALDGHPIYGPYGYSDPKDPSSPIKRIKSSFRLRDINTRTTLPEWARGHHPGVPTQLAANQQGPDVSDRFPLGRYIEDFDFVDGLGDLDVYNGRFTVTPEFPTGTYAYYVTVNDDGTPAFPYIIGLQYYGAASGGRANTVPAAARDYFANGETIPTDGTTPSLLSWFTKNSRQDALVTSGFDPSVGPKATWPTDVPRGARVSGGVTTPTPADVQRIRYTDAAVYINSTGLGSYVMGPWFAENMPGGVFMNFPSSQNVQMQFPRTPAVAATKQNTGLGAVGLWVNGVAVFNVLDGASYSTASRNDAGGGIVNPGALQVSAASLEGGPTAPGALMSATALFGAKLAKETVSADPEAAATTLGGATVTVRDATGTTYPATISFASPERVNYRIPEGVAPGFASVTIAVDGVNSIGSINIVPVYPAMFQANAEGLADAYVARVRDGAETIESISEKDESGASRALSIDLGGESDEVYLVLLATGLGKADSDRVVTATIGGVAATVVSAGPQGTVAGLDRIKLLIPRSLAGKGRVDIVVTVGGKPSNPVNVTIR